MRTPDRGVSEGGAAEAGNKRFPMKNPNEVTTDWQAAITVNGSRQVDKIGKHASRQVMAEWGPEYAFEVQT